MMPHSIKQQLRLQSAGHNQHHATYLPDGHIMLIDNGDQRPAAHFERQSVAAL